MKIPKQEQSLQRQQSLRAAARKATFAVKGGNAMKRFLKSRAITIITILWIAVGVWAGMHLAGWTFIESLYVMTQIFTTIGYGDMAIPKHMHLFMAVYVTLSLVLVANIINAWIEKLSSKFVNLSEESSLRKALRQFEVAMHDGISTEADAARECGPLNAFIVALAVFVLMLFTGASYITYEQDLKWSESVYMAVITMSTVGFGDYAFHEDTNRIFGIVWMVLGVLSTGNMVQHLTEYIHWIKMEQVPVSTFAREVCDSFDVIDEGKNGNLSKSEFRTWFLLHHGLIKRSDLDEIDQLFAVLDYNETGKLEFDTITSCYTGDVDHEDGDSDENEGSE